MYKKPIVFSIAVLLVTIVFGAGEVFAASAAGSISEGGTSSVTVSSNGVTLSVSAGVEGSYWVDDTVTTSSAAFAACARAGNRSYWLSSAGSSMLGLSKDSSATCSLPTLSDANAPSNSWTAALAKTDT